ncbi:MAG: MFS transporter [Lachnospiraceae bacterium]|nr:MFS transporter [Lachnospiraceae bacterium]
MKIRYKYKTVMVGFAFMSIMAFWQMYDNIVPLILKNTFSLNEVIIGAIMAVDNVLALFLLPIFGSLSDKIHTPLGKRMPFIIIGTVAANIALFFMPIADNSRNLVIFLIMTGFVLLFMSVFRSPAVALMPDITPKPLRSKANAIINLMGTVGGIYILAMISVLVSEGTTPNYQPLFISLIVFMLLSTAILALVVKENKWTDEARQTDRILEGSYDNGSIVDTPSDEQVSVRLSADKTKSLIFILLSVSLWYMAYNAVTTAFSRYATQVWGSESGSYANYLMIATVVAIISYIPIGILSARFGRKKVIMVGIIGLILGFFGCFIAVGAGPFVITMFAIVGVSWAAINVNSFPMAVDIASEGDIGKYTGYYYTFSMAAQVLTPILSGAFLQYVSYKTLFPYAVIFSIAAFITMTQVRHGDTLPTPKKSMLEHLDVGD